MSSDCEGAEQADVETYALKGVGVRGGVTCIAWLQSPESHFMLGGQRIVAYVITFFVTSSCAVIAESHAVLDLLCFVLCRLSKSTLQVVARLMFVTRTYGNSVLCVCLVVSIHFVLRCLRIALPIMILQQVCCCFT